MKQELLVRELSALQYDAPVLAEWVLVQQVIDAHRAGRWWPGILSDGERLSLRERLSRDRTVEDFAPVVVSSTSLLYWAEYLAVLCREEREHIAALMAIARAQAHHVCLPHGLVTMQELTNLPRPTGTVPPEELAMALVSIRVLCLRNPVEELWLELSFRYRWIFDFIFESSPGLLIDFEAELAASKLQDSVDATKGTR